MLGDSCVRLLRLCHSVFLSISLAAFFFRMAEAMLALVEDRLGILHIWLFIVSVKYELVTLLCGKLLLKFTGRCRDLVSDIVLVALPRGSGSS